MSRDELYMLDVMNYLDAELVEAADKRAKAGRAVVLKYALMAAAVILVITVGMVSLFSMFKNDPPQKTEELPQTSLELPEVEWVQITLNVEKNVELEVKEGVVTSFKTEDPALQSLANESELNGLSVEQAVRALIRGAIEKRYIGSERDMKALLASLGEGSLVRRILFDWTVEIAENMLDEEIVTACKGARPPLSDELAKEIGTRYGVKKKQVQYLMNLFKYTDPMVIEDRTLNLVHEVVRIEMYSIAFPPKYQVGEYDEYGEKVLYVRDYEDLPAFRIPLEDYPESYQEEMRKSYTKRDLEILYGPCVWTTMPYVIAQSEEQVVALLHERNIAVHIQYSSSDSIAGVDHAHEYEIGDCILQDKPAGTRLRSDRVVHLWVYHPGKAKAEKQALVGE